MAVPLRFLMLEDNSADAELVQFELQEAGIAFTLKVVMTEEDFVRAIQEFSPDLILSDYDLPTYNGALALAEAKRSCPDIPFILVTGAVTEDRAIDILTQGAKDYVLKNRLNQRLVPAVKRALAEAEELRARKQAEAELREAHRTLEERVKIRTAELEAEMEARKKTEESLQDSEERQRLVLQASSIGTFEVDLLTGEGRWNATEFELLGLKPGDVKADPGTFFRFVHPDDVERLRNEWEEATGNGKFDTEFRIVRADGRECWLAGKGTFIFDGHPDGGDTGTGGNARRFMGVNFDITERKRSEETLRESEARLRETLRSVADEIWIIDTQGRIVSLSDSVRENLGVSSDKWADIESALDQLEILRPDGTPRPREDAPLSRALRGEVIRNEGEMIRNMATGQLRWREVFGTPVRDEEGRIIGAVVVVRDSTERKKAEEALRESEERHRGLFTTMNEGFILCEVLTDEDGRPADFRYLDVNPAGERFFGRPRKEIVGHTYREIGGTKADAEWIAILGNIALTGQPASLESYAPVGGCWVDLHAYSPRPGQFAAVFADITERKRAEAEIARLASFPMLNPDPTLEVDFAGVIHFANPAMERLFPDCRQRGLEHPFLADWEAVAHSFCEGESKGKMRELNINGRLYLQMMSFVEEVRHIRIYAHDITLRKEAEKELVKRAAELEDINKDLESFSYSVSHDLRAPLRAIDGYSRMILKKQGKRLDEETRQRLQMIKDNTEKMNRLIDDLLALSRLGRQAVTKKSLNMEELVSDVWSELLAMHPDRKITLKNGQMPVALGDRSLIWQVYTNLLDNAVKFTHGRECGLIETGAFVQNGEMIYYVRDNGVGFDMEFSDKLFGAFQRLHSEKEYEGTGIGLALVQRIIHRHGGRVWAEGEIDKGATFYFSLATG